MMPTPSCPGMKGGVGLTGQSPFAAWMSVWHTTEARIRIWTCGVAADDPGGDTQHDVTAIDLQVDVSVHVVPALQRLLMLRAVDLGDHFPVLPRDVQPPAPATVVAARHLAVRFWQLERTDHQVQKLQFGQRLSATLERSRGRDVTTARSAGAGASLCCTPAARTAMTPRSIGIQAAASTSDRAIRVRCGCLTGWISSGSRSATRCTTRFRPGCSAGLRCDGLIT
jgi:hypothetical protein